MLAPILCAAAPLLAPPTLASPTLAPQTQGTFTLITDPAGALSVADCSDNGNVVTGVTTTSPGMGYAWIWDPAGGFTQLPPSPLSAFPPMVRAISGDGNVVVGWLDSPINVVEGFKWSAGSGLTLLPAVSNQAGIALSSPEAINGDGSLSGGYGYHTDLDQPTVWDASGTPSILPFVAGYQYGWVSDFSAGDVAVGTQWGNLVSVGFRHSPTDGLTALQSGPLGTISGALACSGDGEIVYGYIGDSGVTIDSVVRWDRDGRIEHLFDLPTDATAIRRMRVDHAGRSIVLMYRRQSGSDLALHWSEDRGLRTMNAVLADAGLSSAALLSADGLSGDGNVIAGKRGISDAYVLRQSTVDPGPLGQDLCPPTVPNSRGETPSLGAFGSGLASANDLVLHATGLPRRTFAILIAGRQTTILPGFGGTLGTLCIAPPFGRYSAPQDIRRVGVIGRMSLRVDTSSVPDGVGTFAIQPGETWTFQCWYRDVVGGSSASNLTSARSIVFQ